MKIDESTLVPIGWVFMGFGAITGVIIWGSFWISAVDFRLSRIEEKLSIPPYHSEETPLVSEGGAFAGEKTHAYHK